MRTKFLFILFFFVLVLAGQQTLSAQHYRLPRVKVGNNKQVENRKRPADDKVTTSAGPTEIIVGITSALDTAGRINPGVPTIPDSITTYVNKPAFVNNKPVYTGSKKHSASQQNFRTVEDWMKKPKQLKRVMEIKTTTKTNFIIFFLIVVPVILLILTITAIVFLFLALANPLSAFPIVCYILFGVTGLLGLVYAIISLVLIA